MAAKILSRLKENREEGGGTTQKSTNTFITSLTGHLPTIFSSNTLYLNLPLRWRGYLLGQSLVTFGKCYPFQSVWMLLGLLLLQYQILIMLVAKVMLDKGRVLMQKH